MRLKLISCEIFYREFCAAISRSVNTIEVEFLTKGLHDIGAEVMLDRLQSAVDRVESSRYHAVLLGYGLCNNGIAGLTARQTQLVVPRAHDCITLFLGSKERYLDYFQSHPGVFFETTGWLERGESDGELSLGAGKEARNNIQLRGTGGSLRRRQCPLPSGRTGQADQSLPPAHFY